MKIATFILSAMSLIGGTTAAQAVTVVLDFNDADQANTNRWNDAAEQVSTFGITGFGMADTAANRSQLYSSILAAVQKDYSFDIGHVSGNSFYNGQKLNINFEIGDHGIAPLSGETEHFFVQIGSSVRNGESSLGRAADLAIRGKNGIEVPGVAPDGAIVASIFSNNIAGIYYPTLGYGFNEAVNLLAGTISHEIGHTLGLPHLDLNKPWTTKNGLTPLMPSGATGLGVLARRHDREFATSGTDFDRGTTFNSVAVLTLALGTQPVPEPSTTLLTGAALGMMAFRRKRLSSSYKFMRFTPIELQFF